VKGDFHARFRENVRVRFLCVTRLADIVKDNTKSNEIEPKNKKIMFEQLTLVSALLGGFAFTFLGAILSKIDSKKLTSVMVIISALTATMFFLCTLGWALFGKASIEDLNESAKSKHKYLFMIFIFGIVLFNVLLAMSGWIRSKNVGIATTIIGVFAFLSLMFLFKGSIS